MFKKKIYVLGGGTFAHVRNHLSVAMPAFGETAREIALLCNERFDNMETHLLLTKMANPQDKIAMVTNDDVEHRVLKLKEDVDTKVIFFTIIFNYFSMMYSSVVLYNIFIFKKWFIISNKI